MVKTPLVCHIKRKDSGSFTRAFVILLDDTVLDFHKQDTLNRLIYAAHSQLTLLHGLLERCHYDSYLVSAIWPLNQVITGNDREHSSLAQCPSITNTMHIKTIGNHHAIITQLISKEIIDGLLREFGRQYRINCWYQYISRHNNCWMIFLDHQIIRCKIDVL